MLFICDYYFVNVEFTIEYRILGVKEMTVQEKFIWDI